MATSSRSGTPADPTLRATTDDEARGGLFARSNVANPVSGVDINGDVVNDSTVTLTLSYADGTSQEAQFTLNRVNDYSMTFDVPGDTGGGGPTTDTNNYVTGGDFGVTTPNMLTLTREGLDNLQFDLSSLTPRSVDFINNLITTAINNTDIEDLMNVPALTTGTGGDVLAISSTDATQTEWVTPDPAQVSTTSFSSSDNTVTATAGTGADAGTVNLQARTLVGNGTTSSTTTAPAMSLIVDPATGYRVEEIGSTGVYVLERIEEAGEPAEQAPPPSNALSESPPLTFMIEPMGGTFAMDSDVTATIMVPSGAPAVTPMVTRNPDGMSATAVIPMGGANAPGDYTATFTTTTTTPDGTRGMPETTSATTVRFIPFFQSRSPITQANHTSATVSTRAWNGEFNALDAAGRTIYVAVLSTEVPTTHRFADQGGFPTLVTFGDTITVTLSDTTTRTFNTFSVRAGRNTLVNNFRSTR